MLINVCCSGKNGIFILINNCSMTFANMAQTNDGKSDLLIHYAAKLLKKKS